MRGDMYSKDGQDFPFRLLRMLGWALLILAVLTLMLGVVDIGWTAGNYVGNNCNSANTNFDTTHLALPCNHDSLVWTWVATPVWASLFVMITGIIGTRFSAYRMENLKLHRDIFGVLCALACLLWGPAIIVISSLEVFYAKDVFFYMNNVSAMAFGDVVKVVVPMLVIVFAFFMWIVTIVGMCVACCCAPIVDEAMEMIAPPSTVMRPTPRSAQRPTYPRPAPPSGPVMPMPSYPAYPYYNSPYYRSYGGYGYPALQSGESQYGAGAYGAGAYGAGAYGAGAYGTQAYRGYSGAQGYSDLANALVPYSGNYGGATYGGYGTRQIAQNPYI